MKSVCDSCNNMAVWLLMSGSEKYCDICVPRGCSCNVELRKGIEISRFDEIVNDPIFKNEQGIEIIPTENDYIQRTDELGREYPCCEFLFDLDGFEEN